MVLPLLEPAYLSKPTHDLPALTILTPTETCHEPTIDQNSSWVITLHLPCTSHLNQQFNSTRQVQGLPVVYFPSPNRFSDVIGSGVVSRVLQLIQHIVLQYPTHVSSLPHPKSVAFTVESPTPGRDYSQVPYRSKLLVQSRSHLLLSPPAHPSILRTGFLPPLTLLVDPTPGSLLSLTHLPGFIQLNSGDATQSPSLPPCGA